ncbi:hypothetical protein ABKN59_001220 [Abortiporus biennis]
MAHKTKQSASCQQANAPRAWQSYGVPTPGQQLSVLYEREMNSRMSRIKQMSLVVDNKNCRSHCPTDTICSCKT